ncbi:MAG: hypothetical protein NT145_00285 [Elusimicrobia bacterium]|nr:hypothetical protein [Elusimicrobiota bacterium]
MKRNMLRFVSILVFLFSIVLIGYCGQTENKESGKRILLANESICFNGTFDYFSKYVFRGVTVDEDPVVQPSFSINYKTINASFWSSMPIQNTNDAVDSNEIDLTVSYTKSFEPADISIGHVSYHYPYSGSSSTKEWFVSLTINNLPVGINIMYYDDYDYYKGSYSSLEVTKNVSLINEYDIETILYVHLGSYVNYDIYRQGGDYVLGTKIIIPVREKMTITPSLFYSVPFGDVADENIGNQIPSIYGGFSLGFCF